MTLPTTVPGSRACWEPSSCEGGIGAASDWFSERLCVYHVLMCALVFLGLQTHSEPVLANGIYGKQFK